MAAVAAEVRQPKWTDTEVLLEYLRSKVERQATPQQLSLSLMGAERFLQRYSRRQFEPQPKQLTDSPVAKSYRTRPNVGRYRIADLWQEQSVVLAGVPMVASPTYGYDLDYFPDEPAVWVRLANTPQLLALFTGPVSLTITGWWGWHPVPEDILDACYRLASRMVRERDASYSDSILLPEGGILQYFRQLPATVQAAVQTYRNTGIASASLARPMSIVPRGIW